MARSFAASERFVLGLMFACYIVIGMGGAYLGVAWPFIRGDFGQPLDVLVYLLASSTTGFVVGSTLSSRIIARVGIGRFLLLANYIAAIAMFGYGVAPSWELYVLNGMFAGAAIGSIGAGLNIYIAATSTVRVMNWLHAMYGIGATIGPLLMTAIVGAGLGWRLGYVIAGTLHLALGLLFMMVQGSVLFRGMSDDPESTANRTHHTVPLVATLRRPIVLISILLFLLYTGVETTTGQWTFTLFTESRFVSTYLAGLMTSLFWAMLTLGRLLIGTVAGRIGATSLLRWCMAGSVVSAALFLINNQQIGFIAVLLMGLSLSVIYPTLISDTPRRMGAQYAATVIGVVTGASSLGSAILPGSAGILAGHFGLEVLGLFLLASSALMTTANEAAMWLANREAR